MQVGQAPFRHSIIVLMMIIPNSITPLTTSEHPRILQLFRRMPRQHTHLDWRTLQDWLADPALRCWVAGRDGSIEAMLGATIEVVDAKSPCEPIAAWLRFAVPPLWGAESSVFNALWDALQHDLRSTGVNILGVLDIDGWIGRYARSWGFAETNAVLTLSRQSKATPPYQPVSVAIRNATSAELPAVVNVDTAAFDPLWRYNHKDLTAAAHQAATFTVAEIDREIVAYQLSTRYAGSGHLARLAVKPEYQGHRLGGSLVHRMICLFLAQGIHVITVNTQADNHQSQRLYIHYGFEFTGHRVPVWTREL
jgi:ribosomal protein S18 acetylase RimI-like enzyme